MGVRMTREDLSGCVTNEELARLFEHAFGTWQSSSPDHEGRRETPRVLTGEAKPIFVVSYAYKGREVELNRRAPIVDISADGLGVTLAESLPVGAVVCFAFEGRGGDRNYGVALVAWSVKHQDGCRIGLTFAESARCLEVDPPADEVEAHPASAQGRRGGFNGLRQAAAVAYRVLTQRRSACEKLETTVYDKKASFVVEAKLFRYSAALFVEGRKIAHRSGMLRDRLRSVFSDVATPTIIHLEGGGFSAWAALRPHAVTDCSLGLSLQLKQQVYSRVASSVPLRLEPLSLDSRA